MRRIVKRLPTPAMIVAVVAVVLAVGGTAIAGGTKKQFKNKALQGPLTYVTVTTNVNTTGGGGTAFQVSANCPSGFKPTGGAVRTTNPSTTTNFFAFQQYPTATGWAANVYAGLNATTPEPVLITAICAKVKSSTGTLVPPTL
jgi:hypothetical protein